ncbi:MAG: hypothetical protein P8171_26115 [Candidatus Thiodiazotropha sp.]
MAKDDEPDYGPRLTDEEYDRAVVALVSELPPVPSRQQQREVRRRELDLAIDHRLGCDFPRARRDALWAVQQKVERRRFRLMFKYLLRRFFAKSLIKDAQGLAGYLVKAYGEVLNEAELECFFGEEEVRHPTLPVEPDQLKK